MKTALRNLENWRRLVVGLAMAAAAATVLWFLGLAVIAAIPFFLVAATRGENEKGGSRAGDA